jgi:hypothetical protein
MKELQCEELNSVIEVLEFIKVREIEQKEILSLTSAGVPSDECSFFLFYYTE